MKITTLQDHLYGLEERLLHPDREPDRKELFSLLTDDFREFCSSGRIFNRQQVLDDLLSSTARPATIHHFYVEALAETVALVTYRVTTPVAVSHRSSLWVFRDNRWQLQFHQGTIAD
jgi:hypothetical protein